MPSDEFLSEAELYERIKQRPKNGIGSFYKKHLRDKVWWVDTSDREGLFLFSFDRREIFNLFKDYPHKLTPEQKAIFDKENPYWAEFFSDRA